jgi:hypothetical protein
MACGGGHLEAAQWLVDRFGLTADDARAEGCIVNAFQSACRGGAPQGGAVACRPVRADGSRWSGRQPQ